MKLFSKRNKPDFDNFQRERQKIPIRFIKKRQELLNDEARNRIISQIQFLTTSNNFLEPYILIEDKKSKIFCLNGILLDNFSLSELGYKFSDFFKFRELKFVGNKLSDDEEQTTVTIYDDYKLFDLIETIILFAKESKREDIIFRINKIYLEESCNWKILKHLITRNGGESLSDMANQLKDDKLRIKLKAYYDFYENEDYINSAKISSDILNIIFSDFLQNNKKKQIETVKNNIVNVIVSNTEEEKEKKEKMKSHINELLISSKNLSNDIFDVRHSEKSTIRISNPFIYKLISQNNMSLIELVLTSLKDEYILSEAWESIKAEYLDKYNINKNMIYFYPDKDDEINPEDIPF